MTDHDLRDLLHDRVADLDPTRSATEITGVAGAWRAGRRRRRRQTTLVAAGAAVAVAATAGLVQVVGDRTGPGRSPTPPAATAPTTAATSVSTPDARIGGVPLFLAPADDQALPRVTPTRPRLPEEIDLSADAPALAEDPIDHAEAAFAVPELGTTAMLLAEDGTLRSLDLGSGAGLTTALLSPTGRYVLAVRRESLAVVDLESRSLEPRTIQAAPGRGLDAQWSGEFTVAVDDVAYDVRDGSSSPTSPSSSGVPDPGADLGAAAFPVGRRLTAPSTAQVWILHDRLHPDGGQPRLTRVNQVVAVTGQRHGLLGLREPGEETGSVSYPGLQAWLDDDTLLYSAPGSGRLIAWTVGTRDFALATVITGVVDPAQVVASYARE